MLAVQRDGCELMTTKVISQLESRVSCRRCLNGTSTVGLRGYKVAIRLQPIRIDSDQHETVYIPRILTGAKTAEVADFVWAYISDPYFFHALRDTVSQLPELRRITLEYVRNASPANVPSYQLKTFLLAPSRALFVFLWLIF